jgi:hypothetical protein
MRPVERFIRGPRNSDASPSSNIGLPGQPGRGAYLISSEHLPSLWHVGCVLVYGSLCLATFYHASVESDVLQIAVAVLLANAAGLSALFVDNHLKACTWMLQLDESGIAFRPRHHSSQFAGVRVLLERFKPAQRWTWSQVEPFSLSIPRGVSYIGVTRIVQPEGCLNRPPATEINIPLSGLRGIHTRSDAEQLVDRLNEWQRYFAPTQRQALASAAVEDISASTVQAGPSRRRGLVPILMAIAICAAFLTLFWDHLAAFVAQIGPLPVSRFQYQGPSSQPQSFGRRF